MAIAKDETLLEHGIASVTCLLSGFDVFNRTFDIEQRQFRVLKGLHAFHVYATEYWTDYLPSQADLENSSDRHLHLISLACELAARLHEGGPEAHSSEHQRNSSVGGAKAACWERQVASFLTSRSLKMMESQCPAAKGKL